MNDIFWHLFIIVSVLLSLLTTASMLIWLERRLLALWQDRYGPNRVGPFGLLQVIADVLKIFTRKTGFRPLRTKRSSCRADDHHDLGA
jgi:NADH-quinone oxidoreductase subunit H